MGNPVEFPVFSVEEIWKQWSAWCDRSGPFPAFEGSWELLPSELHIHVLDFLASSHNNAAVSRLSLVSQAWSRRFRPRLFAELALMSVQDCRTLYGILRSSLSAWLAEHIARLDFYDNCFPHNPLSLAIICLLPSCCTIESDSSSHRAPLLRGRAPHNVALKSALRNITSLSLSHYHFPSLRTLLRALADIVWLRHIGFTRVTWSGDPLMTADTARNVCTGSFIHVRSIRLQSCTDNVAVPAWILAAASTRHSFTRRQAAPGLAIPAETWAIIELLRTFLNDASIGYSRFTVKGATPDSYKFVGTLPFSASGTPEAAHREHQRQRMFQLRSIGLLVRLPKATKKPGRSAGSSSAS